MCAQQPVPPERPKWSVFPKIQRPIGAQRGGTLVRWEICCLLIDFSKLCEVRHRIYAATAVHSLPCCRRLLTYSSDICMLKLHMILQEAEEGQHALCVTVEDLFRLSKVMAACVLWGWYNSSAMDKVLFWCAGRGGTATKEEGKINRSWGPLSFISQWHHKMY